MVDAATLQGSIRIEGIERWCASIDKVLSAAGEKGEIYCGWGQFTLHREVIRDGLRFTLPTCPNALQWTVTAEANGVLVHCSINRRDHEPDFIESLQRFVDDWGEGLVRGFRS